MMTNIVIVETLENEKFSSVHDLLGRLSFLDVTPPDYAVIVWVWHPDYSL